MRRFVLLAGLVGVGLGFAAAPGCAGVGSVPAPPISNFLPHGYRALKVYRVDLNGGPVPDVVVTSGTRSNRASMGGDLQILTWSPIANRWRLSFDGRSATWASKLPDTQDSNGGPGYPYGLTHAGKPQPILGTLPDLEVSVDGVQPAAVFGGARKQLVFSATYVAGGGMQGILAVIAVRNGIGKLIYYWEGDTGLGPWRVSRNVIHAEANYLAPYDSECCPIRTYHFSLGVRAGHIVEVSDDRPFLGVVLRNTHSGYPSVVLVAPRGPSAGRLRPDDVILRVENAPAVRQLVKRPFEYTIFDTVSSFRAGQVAHLLIERNGKRLRVAVKLGSLMDHSASTIRTPTTDGSENAV